MTNTKLQKAVKDLLAQYLSYSDTIRALQAIMAGIPVHITGKQRPTGKSMLCSKLNELNINAYEDWEKENTDNFNGVYIEIALNQRINATKAPMKDTKQYYNSLNYDDDTPIGGIHD